MKILPFLNKEELPRQKKWEQTAKILIKYSLSHRLERLDHLAQKFKHKCDIHEEWSYGKEDLLQAQDFKKCRLNELKVWR